ncbi:MAG: MaoC family dehydratase [Candidatus Cyclonatronum sp.]|uniref:MaoC family dehydratase n=1 Tax=Cyclonatronum sp. TaxID=3024185 RepID=UPI0025C59351|nr:MaoC family dehydratase [Cyclonatronum sp.]MCC5935169.1 MaoC family dehydratase [Balneolales bacterium]MCH8486754.1 MaoC family dehydratase [Cyclonatronum sp.]
MKRLTISDLKTGDRAEFSKTISEHDVYAFAGITGDFNPLHVDAEYAAQTRFGARISHGALLAGLISTVVGMKLPGPGALYASQSLKFLRPVYIGDTITAFAEVAEVLPERNRVKFRTGCRNQKGEAVAEGESVLLPSKEP